MFYVYIMHTEGADKIQEFPSLYAAERWIGYQYYPKLFYTVDWTSSLKR